MVRFAAALLFAVGALAFGLDSPRPVLVLDAHDQAWAAWTERQGPVTVGRVARWDGSAWAPVGGALNRDPEKSIASVSLTLGPDGTPWAAWGERPLNLVGVDEGSGLLHIARWTGTAWDEPAPSPSRSKRTVAERPQVKVDGLGRPWVIWSEITPDFNVDNVYLAVLKDQSWTVVDGGTLTTDVSTSSRSRDLVLGPDNQPLLAFSRMVYRHDFQVFLGPWDGAQWAPLAGALNLNPEAYASFPSVALDAQGRPTVAFLQASSGFKLVVKRWTGETWELRGTPGSLGARNPKVVLGPDGAALLAAVENLVGVTVRQRTNSGWVDLGSSVSTPGAFVDTLDLAADSQGNPWVIWAEDDAAGQRLGLKRWTGTSWLGVPAPPFAPRP
jgi:hypothetical protein